MDHLRGGPPGMGPAGSLPRDMPPGGPSVYQRAAMSGAPGLPPLGGAISAGNPDPPAPWPGMPHPGAGFGGFPPPAAARGAGMPMPGQAPSSVVPGVLQDALSYLERVQREFAGRQEVYLAFLSIMRDFKGGKMDTNMVVARVSQLFQGHDALLQAFQAFLTGAAGPSLPVAVAPGATGLDGSSTSSSSSTAKMQQAMEYMDKVKAVCGNRPAIYGEFLRLVRASQEQSLDMQQVILSVSRLFAGNHELVEGFNAFLPDGYRLLHRPQPSGPPGISLGAHGGPAVTQQPPVQQQQLQLQRQQQQHPPAPAQQQQPPPQLPQQLALPEPPPPQQQQQQPGAGAAHSHRPPRDTEGAMSYMNAVRDTFRDDPLVYQQFLEVMKGFQSQRLSIPSVIQAVCRLFAGHEGLLTGFDHFLPEGHHMPQSARQHALGPQTPMPPAATSLPPPLRKEGVSNGPPSVGPAAGAAGAGAGAAAAPGAQVGDAMAFMGLVKEEYAGDSRVYDRFLTVMRDYQGKTLDTPGVIEAVSELFAGNNKLLVGFNAFLPKGYSMPIPASAHRASPVDRQQQKKPQPPPAGGICSGPPPPVPVMPTSGGGSDAAGTNAATDFVGRVKARFAHDQARYQTFVELLQRHEHQQLLQQAGQPQDAQAVEEVARTVWALFKDHGDLLADFAAFLPTPVQEEVAKLAGGAAQPHLVAAAKEEGDMGMAVGFLNKIRSRFANDPDTYQRFLSILHAYETGASPASEVKVAVGKLLVGDPALCQEFARFLPPQPPARTTTTIQPPEGKQPVAAPAAPAPANCGAVGGAAGGGGGGGGADMNSAVSFVNKVEKRFASEPHKFALFLMALQDFERNPSWATTMMEVAEQLFVDHPDLLADFLQFLPQLQPPAPAPARQEKAEATEATQRPEKEEWHSVAVTRAAPAEQAVGQQVQAAAAAGAVAVGSRPPSVASMGKASTGGSDGEEELVIDDDELSDEGRAPSSAKLHGDGTSAAPAPVEEIEAKEEAAKEAAAETLTISSVVVEPPASTASSVMSVPLDEGPSEAAPTEAEAEAELAPAISSSAALTSAPSSPGREPAAASVVAPVQAGQEPEGGEKPGAVEREEAAPMVGAAEDADEDDAVSEAETEPDVPGLPPAAVAVAVPAADTAPPAAAATAQEEELEEGEVVEEEDMPAPSAPVEAPSAVLPPPAAAADPATMTEGGNGGMGMAGDVGAGLMTDASAVSRKRPLEALYGLGATTTVAVHTQDRASSPSAPAGVEVQQQPSASEAAAFVSSEMESQRAAL